MSTRLGLLLAFVVLAIGTVNVFPVIDGSSHSVSDTLRPFILTTLPVWLVALYAARIVLRSEPGATEESPRPEPSTPLSI